MLFQRQFHAGLADGSIDLTFRLWTRPQVRAGGQYRVVPIGSLEVRSVDRVSVGDISEAEAERSGFADREALLAYLHRHASKRLTARSVVYRVAFRWVGALQPAAPGATKPLDRGALETLAARLDKMDRLSRHGAWTRATLRAIAAHPRVAAARLAERAGRETRAFKADVRKLKNLGLTRSFEVGYELSPHGRQLLDLEKAR